MQRVYQARRQKLIDGFIEALLLALCLAASGYGVALLDALPPSV